MTMKKVILILAIAGVLFAGYLSAVKFFNNTCAFNESCPYFLGYPACYFGFAMFVVIVIYLMFDRWRLIEERTAEISVLTVSFLGIIFAGYFTVKELPALFTRGFGAYFLGLPTCALGLIFYAIIFILMLISLLRRKV